MIQSPAKMVIDSIYAVNSSNVLVDSASQGSSLRYKVLVSNTGEATLYVDSLFIEPDSIVYHPVSPADVIVGGSSRNYYIDYTIAEDADTGTVNLQARGYGYDGNSTSDTTYAVNDEDGATFAGTLTILRKVDLLVNAITSARDTVSQGQRGILFTVELENTGQVDATIDTARLDFQRNLNTYSTNKSFRWHTGPGYSNDQLPGGYRSGCGHGY